MSFFEKFGRSAMELKSVRCLTVTGILIALDLVLKMLSIKITNDLKITFAFIALAAVGMLYGPVVSFIAGALTDIIGFFLTADGGFSPLFTLVEALGAMIYGIFLYGIRPVNITSASKEEGFGKKLRKTVLHCLCVGLLTASACSGIMYTAGVIMRPFTGSEDTSGKIAKLLTDPALIIVAAAIGFLYGAFFCAIVRNSSGEKGDMKSSVRIVAAKIMVVIVCNLILTPVAMVASGYMTFDSMKASYPLRIIKNAIQCPVDCIILLMVMFPILAAYRRIFRDQGKDDRTNEQGGDTAND